MLRFTRNGKYLLAANEGEPNDTHSPTGTPILIVGYEISGTTTISQVDCLED